jgi:hypothetical protein
MCSKKRVFEVKISVYRFIAEKKLIEPFFEAIFSKNGQKRYFMKTIES